MNTIKVMKETYPWIPAGHPDFKWTSGADVQSTWRKYGWLPPSGKETPALVVPLQEPTWLHVARKTK
jgi:hypothetical protein